MNPTSIAQIVVEILLCRGSARKIETDSGIKLQIASSLAMTLLYNV